MLYAWWGRGKLIEQKFDSTFQDFLDPSLGISPIFSTGKVRSLAKYGSTKIALYSQYTAIGARHKWYLLLSPSIKDINRTRPSFYGSGLGLSYLQNTNPTVKTIKGEGLGSNPLPQLNCEFAIAADQDYFAYPLPDFFGYGPIPLVFEKLATKESMSKSD